MSIQKAEMTVERIENGQYVEQVAYPYVEYEHVTMENGMDIMSMIRDDVSTPTVTHDATSWKVGQGDSDVSESIVDSSIASMTIKGQTYQNILPSPSLRNSMTNGKTMQKLNEGYDSVNTVDGACKSAILKGQTLVNLIKNGYTATSTPNKERAIASIMPLDGSKEYTLMINKNLVQVNIRFWYTDGSYGEDYAFSHRAESGYIKNKLRIDRANATGKTLENIQIYSVDANGEITNMMLLEGDYTNVDIPYFTGMQSVKLPVLTTTGKNLWDDNWSKGLTQTSGNVLTGGTYDGFRYNNNLISVDGISTIYLKHFCPQQGVGQFFRVGQYGKDKEWLNKPLTVVTDGIFNIPSDCKYIRVHVDLRYNGTSNNTSDSIPTMMVVSTSKITDYEPYKSNILSTSEDVTLRGIGDVQDTLDCLTGEYTKAIYEYTFTGDEDWIIREGTNGGYSYFHFRVGQLPVRPSYNASANYPIICNRLPMVNYTDFDNGIKSVGINFTYYFRLNFSNCNSNDGATVEDLKAYLKANPTTVQYPISKSVKTVDLSDNVVHSYKDTTHYDCSSEEGSLLPTLAIEEGVKYEAIIKPSTKYSIVFNRTEVASGLTVDLGGTTANVVSTAVGKTIVQITTPPTLSHNYVIFKGLGNVIKDVQVIEGDVVGDEPYFEGMCDVEMPVLTTTGKNLFDINKCKPSKTINDDGNEVTGSNPNQYAYGEFIPINNEFTMSITSDNGSVSNNANGTRLRFYDENKNLVDSQWFAQSLKESNGRKYRTISMNGAKYLKINFSATGGKADTTYEAMQTIQVEEGSVATSYEPYKSNILSFNQKDDKTIVLRSLPNGVCDTLDLETGVYVQRIGEITLNGSETNWSVTNQAGWESTPNTIAFGQSFTPRAKAYNAREISSVICDKFATITADGTWGAGGRDEAGVSINQNSRFDIRIERTKLSGESLTAFKQWLSQNPITVQYEFETPITKTIDLKQHPFAYKDGYVVLTSSSEEVSLTPTIEYSLIANRLGQIQTNQKLVEKQQAQIDELESMVITNLVNTQYQQALNEIKLGVK